MNAAWAIDASSCPRLFEAAAVTCCYQLGNLRSYIYLTNLTMPSARSRPSSDGNKSLILGNLTSRWPWRAAMCRGVSCSLLAAFTGTPASTRAVMKSGKSSGPATAVCSRVLPEASCQLHQASTPADVASRKHCQSVTQFGCG